MTTNAMPSTTLSALIRQGFEEVAGTAAALPGHREEPVLAGLAVRELPRLMHERAVPLARQDEVLAAVIRCYRGTSHPGWSAVLLEMVSPMLVAAGGRFAYIPEGIGREDIDHQLIVEALHVARSFAMPRSSRYVQRWLERRVVRRMARWLVDAVRSQGESLEVVDREGIAHRDADRLFLMELADLGVPLEDLALLYRSQVLGMSVRELAIELGVSVAAVRSRQRRALRQLRQRSPAKFQRFASSIPTAA